MEVANSSSLRLHRCLSCSFFYQRNLLCVKPLSSKVVQHKALGVRVPVTIAALDYFGNHTAKRTQRQVQVRSTEDRPPVSTEFGYSRKDVILIGVGLIALGFASYYGLQAAGVEAGMAGNFVQLAIVLGMCVGWVSSYLWRVANKKMTYAQQLEDYEAAVMQKRLEEMPEEEVDRLVGDVNEERDRRRKIMEQRKQQQQ